MNSPYWSRIEGFYELGPKARREAISHLPLGIDDEDYAALDSPLTLLAADLMSENVLGSFSLPFSVAPNFLIDDRPLLIPMVTEEPSIVAAVSKMAKLAALKGGFHTAVDPPLLKGQLQFYELPDIDAASAVLREKREELIEYLNGLCPRMLERGGGVVDLGFRVIASKIGPMLIIEPVVNVCDAMGANIVNTLMEHLALKMQNIFHKKPGLAILSNFCEQRLASARAILPFNLLATDTAHDQGEEVVADRHWGRERPVARVDGESWPHCIQYCRSLGSHEGRVCSAYPRPGQRQVWHRRRGDKRCPWDAAGL